MVRGEVQKAAALVYVAVAAGLCLVGAGTDGIGLRSGCSAWERLSYPFLHAGFLHFAVNAWCLLTVVFGYGVSGRLLVVSYIVAVTAPTFGATMPTVGLSGVLYASFGALSFKVRRKWLWQAWWAVPLAAGFFLPQVNALLHLYCYLCGILVGFLGKPVRR